MEIRRLREQDLQSLIECRLRALQLDPNAFLTTYDEQVSGGTAHYESVLAAQNDENVVFGALDEGKVVGTAGIFKEKRAKIRHKAMIWGMFVEPSYRGRGIGKELLHRAIVHAKRNMEVNLVQLSVESSNQVAKKLYTSYGFKSWGTEPRAMLAEGKYYQEDHMVLFMDDFKA